MPIYEYQCKSCGHEMEALQKMSDAPLSTCPECGNEALNKKISAAAFRLKGGGWYETDFKTGKKKNVAGDSDSGGASKGGDKAASSDKSSASPASSGSSSSSASGS